MAGLLAACSAPALAGLLAACSAPARNADLTTAEAAERAGDVDAALAAYESAQSSCRHARLERIRRQTCARAHLGRAELLDHEGRTEPAARAYQDAAEALAGDPVAAATATYRAGRLELELGHDVRAYELLWKVVTHYPDQAHAPDALRLVLADGRRRNPAELYRVLGDLVTPLTRTEVGDNLLYAMADLAENDLDDPRAALSLYDKLAAEHDGGLRDDARWHGARLARALGDPEGAVERLRALLATREVSLLVGSYFSVWLDDAQLELGRVLRDDLDRLPAAARAFLRLPEDYPDSILIDDALWETALTWDRAGDRERTCAVLARLGRDFPASRYELHDAPALREARGCPRVDDDTVAP